MALDPRLRSPKEEPLFILCIVVSSIAWLLVVISIIGLLYGAVVLAFVVVAHAVFLANIRGNGVRLSEKQLPDLYNRVRAAAGSLGMVGVPDAYLLQSGGLLNAFATKLLSRRYVVIYSELADRCQDPRQLDFVIGHELGHHAAGHLAWNFFLAPSRLVPWLGPAYSRAREYTSDRCGLHVAGDLEQASRGLAVLAAGGKHAALVDLEAFMEQRHETGDFWMAIRELVASHPYLCKRVAALKEMTTPGSVPAMGRNPFSYLVAPILGISVGGASSMALLFIVYMAVIMSLMFKSGGSLFRLPAPRSRPVSAQPSTQTYEWQSPPRSQ